MPKMHSKTEEYVKLPPICNQSKSHLAMKFEYKEVEPNRNQLVELENVKVIGGRSE